MSAGGRGGSWNLLRTGQEGRGAPDLHPHPPGYPHPGLCWVCLGSPQGRGAFRGGEDALLLQGRPPQPLGRGRLPAATPEGGDESGEGWPAMGQGARTWVSASAEWMESQQDELGARGRVFCSLKRQCWDSRHWSWEPRKQTRPPGTSSQDRNRSCLFTPTGSAGSYQSSARRRAVGWGGKWSLGLEAPVQNLERCLPPRRGPGWNTVTQREAL